MIPIPFLFAIFLASPASPVTLSPGVRLEGKLTLRYYEANHESSCSVAYGLTPGEKTTIYVVAGGEGISCSAGRPASRHVMSSLHYCDISWEPRGGPKAEIHLACTRELPGHSGLPPVRTFDLEAETPRTFTIPYWVPCPGEYAKGGVWGAILELEEKVLAPLPRDYRLDLTYERTGPPGTGPGKVSGSVVLDKEGKGNGEFKLLLPAWRDGETEITASIDGHAFPVPAGDGELKLMLGLGQWIAWQQRSGAETRGTSCGRNIDKMITIRLDETVRLDLPEFRRCGPGFKDAWGEGANDSLYLTLAPWP